MSMFEGWVLETLPDTDFAQFLELIKEPAEAIDNHLRFLPLHQSTVLAYIMCTHTTQQNKCNTIRNFLCSQSVTLLDCSGKLFVNGAAIDKTMDVWGEGKEERAPVFDPEEMLPNFGLLSGENATATITRNFSCGLEAISVWPLAISTQWSASSETEKCNAIGRAKKVVGKKGQRVVGDSATAAPANKN